MAQAVPAKRAGALFAFALAGVTLVGPLAIHLFFPVVPAMRDAFGVSDATAQLSGSIVLFAMAVLTLVYGTLSDRYGRRPLLRSGLVLFLFGTALAGVADRIEVLLLGRLLQAAGAACGLALARAMAQDVFPPERLVKVLAYLTMAYTLGPMISPPIGGFLLDHYGWRSVFVFAFAFGAVIVVLAFLSIFETRRPTAERVRMIALLRGYGRLLGYGRFVGFVMQSGFSSGTFITWAMATAFVMKDTLQRPAAEYGLWFMLFPAGFFIGSLTASRLGGRVRNEVMVLTGASLLVVAAGGLIVWALAGTLSPATLFLPGFVVTFAQGLSLPNAQAGAMAIDRSLAGTAAGVGVAMQFLFAAVLSQTFGLFADGTPGPMLVIAACGAAGSLAAATLAYVKSPR
ncbi:MAG: multidrug effflux MFS transporter [Rhodospirillaceae bacterium]